MVHYNGTAFAIYFNFHPLLKLELLNFPSVFQHPSWLLPSRRLVAPEVWSWSCSGAAHNCRRLDCSTAAATIPSCCSAWPAYCRLPAPRPRPVNLCPPAPASVLVQKLGVNHSTANPNLSSWPHNLKSSSSNINRNKISRSWLKSDTLSIVRAIEYYRFIILFCYSFSISEHILTFCKDYRN